MSQPRFKMPLAVPESPQATDVSIVVPILNEADSLDELLARLHATMNGCRRSYQLVFVNDGSTDASLDILIEAARRDIRVRVVDLVHNAGQHAAILAGFAEADGEIVITLDADLQNPPEEIPRLLDIAERGVDVVGTVREARQDSVLRRVASHYLNLWTRHVANVQLNDYGSMLRAYRRRVVDQILAAPEASSFIPVLAERYSRSVAEIGVSHQPRRHGASRYNFLRLLWLQFDLTTSFSLVPLRLTLIFGLILSALAFLLAFGLLAGRVIMGSEWAVSGVFTVLALLVMLIGSVLFGLGLVGEYIGRIYLEVRRRPPYLVREVIGGSRRRAL